jgi:parallel beta-helix repeat protein
VTSNQVVGISAGPDCAILKSTVSGTIAGPGVNSVSKGVRIESSSINGNGTFGVLVNTASEIAELAVVNCSIHENGSAGISSEASTQVLDSIVSSNGGAGIILTGTGLVRGCTITSNTDSGVELTGNANVVANNTLSANAPSLATAAGILVQGTDNTIDGNRLFSNTQGGIKVNLGGNLVLRNYLARAGATITAVAGNSVAQIITPGAGFISTDPNANFTY